MEEYLPLKQVDSVEEFRKIFLDIVSGESTA